MKKTIYKIKVLGWSKHNSGLKKGHSRILISTGFLTDAKIRNLSPATKLLYLSCLLVAGESVRSLDDVELKSFQGQFEVTHDSLAFQSGVKSGSIQSQLDLLQSLQLVTFEKKEALLDKNRIERKRVDKKEVPAGSERPQPAPVKDFELLPFESGPPSKPKPTTETNRKVWESYRQAYESRWKVEPTRNAMVNANIANFVKRVGETDAPAIIAFYVTHNDGLYIKSQHAMNLAVRDAEGLRTQWLRGKTVTGKDVRDFEKTSTNMNTLSALREGKI